MWLGGACRVPPPGSLMHPANKSTNADESIRGIEDIGPPELVTDWHRIQPLNRLKSWQELQPHEIEGSDVAKLSRILAPMPRPLKKSKGRCNRFQLHRPFQLPILSSPFQASLT
jgi:hypothetical protein